MITPVVKKYVPRAMKDSLARVIKQTQDRYWRARFGWLSSLVPPLQLMHDGGQSYKEFKQNGDEFLRLYLTLCGLQPHERMLDVGSGIGRKTWPLVDYLNERGSYDGLELVKSGVDWCTERYTSKYPNFKFHLIDVHNDVYNPGGTYKAAEYRFPFSDEQFDFVVLNSVFTHMVSAEVENYMNEITRVLRKGGRCLISFFLLNEESLGLIERGKSFIPLRHKLGPARTMRQAQPEWAIGYDEDYVIELFRQRGLETRRPISYGWWCGRDNYLSCQDQILAFKT